MGTKPVRFEIGPVTGTGRSMTAAREDAIQRAAAALDGLWPIPFVFTYRETTIVVWREASGYAWKHSLAAETHLHNPAGYRQTGCETFEDAIDCAKRHLACVTWQPEDGDTPPEWCEGKLRDTVARTFRDHARHHEAVHVHGMDAHAAHAYAGCNPGVPEVWKGLPTRYPVPGYPAEWFPPLDTEPAIR